MAWTKSKTAITVGVSVALLVVGTVVVVKKVTRTRQQVQQARIVDFKANQWPEERKQEIERIKERAEVNETVNAKLIDLRPHLTAQLAEAPLCWKGNNDDNLSEVPPGQNIFAGVPFEVSGSVQLMGGWLKHYHKTYPAAANDIRIDRNCNRLHLLHGNGYITYTNFGTVVAKLVIHYANGSTHDLKLVAGENAFDWWTPLFKSGINEKFLKMGPGTERAWTGSNAYIRKWQPELSLVLYRTTFDNPHPDLKISTVDYVSTETITCPFMVGLTVE